VGCYFYFFLFSLSFVVFSEKEREREKKKEKEKNNGLRYSLNPRVIEPKCKTKRKKKGRKFWL